MSKKFADFELVDRYREAVREMVEAKVQGKQVVTVAEEEKPVVDIMTALKESIEQAKKEKKPMEKATGKEKAAEEKAPSKRRKTS
jgi:DNA end-binding protein Ku